MKKSTLIGISILSVFLLCSLSYKPIIAEKQVIKSKEEVIIIGNEDCGCEDSPNRRFPILCQILLPIALLYKYLIQIYYDYNPPRILLQQYAILQSI